MMLYCCVKGKNVNNISFLGCKPEYYTNGIRVIPIEKDPTLAPWEKVSAAIGISFYDPNTDKDVETVFRRADKKMYQNKINMKAQRKD